MSFFKRFIFLGSLIILGTPVFSQGSKLADATFFEEFSFFFTKEIKYQGVKGNWIFGLNEITAYHKFDYNNDGFNDVFIEFNAAPVDEGNYTNYYAVLFKNENDTSYVFIDYIETVDLQFVSFDNNEVVFDVKDSSRKVIYKLENSKFNVYEL